MLFFYSRYAFSPLLDQDEEDGATESLVHDAYGRVLLLIQIYCFYRTSYIFFNVSRVSMLDGMKIRGSGNSKDSKGRVYVS